MKSEWQAQMSGAKEKTEMEGETERESERERSFSSFRLPPATVATIHRLRTVSVHSQPASQLASLAYIHTVSWQQHRDKERHQIRSVEEITKHRNT